MGMSHPRGAVPYQCQPSFGDAPPPPGANYFSRGEVSFQQARDLHLLLPPRNVKIDVWPGCPAPGNPVAPGQPGTVAVAILGAADLDVFAGAAGRSGPTGSGRS